LCSKLQHLKEKNEKKIKYPIKIKKNKTKFVKNYLRYNIFMENFLTIPEEILLLSVNESGGEIPNDKRFETIIAASILMDLALHNRLDSDLEKLIRVSDEKTSDTVLDQALEMIFENTQKEDPAYWISQIAVRSREFIEYLVASLTLKQVLKVEDQKLFWFFSKRKYPPMKDKEIKEVKLRVRDLVFSNDIPDVRDMVIVSLLHYGELHSLVFSDSELKQYKERIENLAKMDLIGQAISKSLSLFVKTKSTVSSKSLFASKSPEEKLENLVKETKEKFRINDDSDLPSWLRKGTDQYNKTLAFVEETGTADIYYHRIKDKYFVRNFSAQGHVFGSGS
jgi:golgi phosphoprotein 3